MNIDYEVRKSVARWCQVVALEDVGVPDHAARVNIARNLATAISPSIPTLDVYLPNIVALVRAFIGDEPGTALIDTTVVNILIVYVKLGALQG